MTTSDDFKQQLKAGKIIDALTLALGEAVELEITTWVSSAKSDSNTPKESAPSPESCIRTRINIVDGDINNAVGSEFIGNGPYTELQQFHKNQVQDAPQMIQHNLENLQQLFSVLTSTITQLPPASTRRVEGNSPQPPSLEEA
jgi:hypothetical protein